MTVLLSVLIALAMAVFMEGVAWFTHKYVMHGFLWYLHEDHHHPTGRGLQKNDWFAVFFAAISCALIVTGVTVRNWYAASAGFGIALYGIGYFLFHDVMFHRRIRGFRIRAQGRYLKRIVDAHRVHHQNSDKAGGVAFGFLYAPRHPSTPR